MSTLMSLTDASTQLLVTADPALLTPSAGGILDWVDTKSTQATTTVRGVSILLAIIFVVVAAVVSRMAMARVIIAGIAAGLFIWIVFNVTSIQDRVGNELEASAVTTTLAVSSSAGGGTAHKA